MDGETSSYVQHERGALEGFQHRLTSAVGQVLADPRAPVVEADPTFLETVAAQFRLGTSVGALFANKGWRTDLTAGDKQMIPEEVYTRLDQDGIRDHRDAFRRVRSYQGYQVVLDDVKQEQAARARLEQAGFGKSLAAGLVAGLAEPANYVPIGAAVNKVRTGVAALDATLHTAAVAGGSAAIGQAAVLGASPTTTKTEAAENIAVGTLFGAVMGYGIHRVVGPRTAQRVEAGISKVSGATDEQIVKQLDQNITAAREHYVPAGERAKADAAQIIGSSVRNIEADAAKIVEGDRRTGSPSSLSAAAPNVYRDTNRADDRLFGFFSPSQVQKWVGDKVAMMRNPRLELEDALSPTARSVLDRLDVNPHILDTDVSNVVTSQLNVPGEFRALTASWAQAQDAADRLFKVNKAKYNGADDFGTKVYNAVINGGRDAGGDQIVEQAAAHYRNYFDTVLAKYREAGILQEGKDVSLAESYAPIVYMIDNVRRDSAKFIDTHARAFNQSILDDYEKALNTKLGLDAKIAKVKTELAPKIAEEVKTIKADYGHERSSTGKIADVKSKLEDDLKKYLAQLEDTRVADTRKLYAQLQGKEITTKQHAQKKAVIEEQYRRLKDEQRTAIRAEKEETVKKLAKERDDKIAASEAKLEEAMTKLRDDAPEWDKALLRRLTLNKDTAAERAADWSRKLAENFYDGATQNHVVTGHDVPFQEGLSNVLKARKGKVLQSEMAKNGWIDTNIFRLSESYNRRAGMDAAIAQVFKRADKDGNLIGDPTLGNAKKVIGEEYKALIDHARDAGKADIEAKLVAERNRQMENVDILLDMLRGKTDGSTIGNDFRKVGNYAMLFNSIRLMGGTVLSSLTDVANITVANGLGNSLKYGIVPAFKNFKAAMGNLPAHELPDIYKINRTFGIVIEHQVNSRIAAMADLGATAAGDRGQAWMQRVNKTFWNMSGITYWTQFWKNAAASTTNARITMAAVEGWEKQSADVKAWLTNLKLTKSDLAKIAEHHTAQAEQFSAGVPYSALDQWADKSLADKVANALHRESHNIVVTPTAGDKLALQATPLGQLIWQFRTYGVSSSARLISRNAALANIEGGQHAANLYTGLVQLALMGAMVEGVKTTMGDATITGASKDNKSGVFDKWMEKWHKTPGEALYNSLDRSGVFWLLTEPSNVAQKLGLPNIQGLMSLRDEKDKKSGSSRFGNRSVADAALGPTVGLLNDMAKAASIATGAGSHALGLRDDDLKISRSDYASARRLVPFQNGPGMQQVLNWGHQRVGTIFDWPDQ